MGKVTLLFMPARILFKEFKQTNASSYFFEVQVVIFVLPTVSFFTGIRTTIEFINTDIFLPYRVPISLWSIPSVRLVLFLS